MMLILTADLHGNLPATPSGDVLVIAGDICPDFRGPRDLSVKHQAEWLDGPFRAWLHERPVRHILAVWGNHDFVGECGGWPDDLPWTLLHDSGCTVEGVRFFGLPWVAPISGFWAFEDDHEGSHVQAALQPTIACDVLVSHGPPYGAGDRVLTGQQVGSRSLRRWIDVAKPHLVVTGHIHEAAGTYQLASTTVRNVSFVDERYHPRQQSMMQDEVYPGTEGA